MSTEYDFGFSFEDSEPTTPVVPQENTELKSLQEKVDSLLTSQTQLLDTQTQLMEERYKAKLKDVENLILPLLYNLMKNPDKAYIKWENRAPVIQKQIDKITAITRS
jgi:predicted transcriptional regulator